MNKLGIILVVIMITLVGMWVWVVINPNQTSQSEVKSKVLSEQSDDQGQVTVDVTPVFLEPGKETKFSVTLNTHTVELSYDLLTVSNLADDKGNNLKPISWSGGSGGHHLVGELVFPSLSTKAKSVQLTIANISGFDRKFRWELL